MDNRECPIIYLHDEECFHDCERERCAWWDEKHQCCAVLTIASRKGEKA